MTTTHTTHTNPRQSYILRASWDEPAGAWRVVVVSAQDGRSHACKDLPTAFLYIESLLDTR